MRFAFQFLCLIAGLLVGGDCFSRSVALAPAERMALATRSDVQPSANIVRGAILRAAKARGWTVAGEKDGELDLSINVRGQHEVAIAIDYDAEGMTVRYVSSANMNYRKDGEKEFIHPGYYAWLGFLTTDIKMFLVSATPAELLAEPGQAATAAPPARENLRLQSGRDEEMVAISLLLPEGLAEGATAEALKTCTWSQSLLENVVSANPTRVRAPVDARNPSKNSLLIRVTSYHVPAGGGFSGPKWISLHGELKSDGRLLDSFDFRRVSAAGFRLTACSVADHIGEALTVDVNRWLATHVIVSP